MNLQQAFEDALRTGRSCENAGFALFSGMVNEEMVELAAKYDFSVAYKDGYVLFGHFKESDTMMKWVEEFHKEM